MKDNQAKYPQLRFKGFTDPWEERKLGEVATLSSSKRIHSSDYVTEGIPFYRGSEISTGGITGNQELFISKEKFDEIKEKYGVPSVGDLLVTAVGTLGNLWKVDSRRFYYKDGNLIQISKMQVNSDYLLTYFTGGIGKKRLLDSAAGSNQKALTMVKMREITVDFPSEDEQQKIGSFFKQLDDTIALHQRKLAKLKELKQGYLQKLFPKNGAKVPELRFAGFADAWEERKLVSMTNYKNGKGHEDKQSTIGKLELINLNSISISGGLKHSGKFIDEADDTLQKDDLVMILSDVGHGDLLGRVALIPEDDRFVLNQRVALLRPNATADPQFLFSYINAHQYYFKAQGAGMSQLNISKGSVENFISFVPIIEEQKKIGTFFKQLDNTITLHQRKLEKLQELKKGYLQKMFC